MKFNFCSLHFLRNKNEEKDRGRGTHLLVISRKQSRELGLGVAFVYRLPPLSVSRFSFFYEILPSSLGENCSNKSLFPILQQVSGKHARI